MRKRTCFILLIALGSVSFLLGSNFLKRKTASLKPSLHGTGKLVEAVIIPRVVPPAVEKPHPQDSGRDASPRPPLNLTQLILAEDQGLMTLAMHFTSKPSLMKEFLCTFMRAAAVFWPPQFGGLTLILDEESAQDHKFADHLKAREGDLSMKFTFKYQPLPDDPSVLYVPTLKGPGHVRQMWNYFFLDLYVDTPVLALMDADIMFSTPVIPEVMFSGDKIKVHGRTVEIVAEYRHLYRDTMNIFLGKEKIGFFGYFPTYLWTDTFKNCRRYILNRFNTSHFEDAFKKAFKPNHFNSAHIVINYAFYFEHDRYEWSMQLDGSSVVEYNRKYLQPGIYLRPAESHPGVCVAIHKPRYQASKSRPRSPFHQGYCAALKHIAKSDRACAKQKLDKKNIQLFDLQSVNHIFPGGWCYGKRLPALCRDTLATYYRTFAKYYGMGLYDFDLSRVRAVERVASEMNVTCHTLT